MLLIPDIKVPTIPYNSGKQLIELKLNKLINFRLGGVYKPRGQTRGRGVVQMTTTLNNSYLVKVST